MSSPTSETAPRAIGLEDFEAPLTRAERRAIAGQLGPLLAGAGILALAYVYALLVPGQAQLASMLQALAAILVSIPILRRGLGGFLSRQANDLTEQLVSLAILAAMATGDFVTATLVPLFLELGHLFEERSSRGARAAIDGIRKLSAQRANRWVDGVEHEVDPGELQEGDQVVVRPGEVIPVDGEANSTVTRDEITPLVTVDQYGQRVRIEPDARTGVEVAADRLANRAPATSLLTADVCTASFVGKLPSEAASTALYFECSLIRRVGFSVPAPPNLRAPTDPGHVLVEGREFVRIKVDVVDLAVGVGPAESSRVVAHPLKYGTPFVCWSDELDLVAQSVEGRRGHVGKLPSLRWREVGSGRRK